MPGPADNVVILNGRTVRINQNNKNSLSLEIKLGGNLDLQATNSHNFGIVIGQGLLKLSSGTFPGGYISVLLHLAEEPLNTTILTMGDKQHPTDI